jgi:hypothetical protein
MQIEAGAMGGAREVGMDHQQIMVSIQAAHTSIQSAHAPHEVRSLPPTVPNYDYGKIVLEMESEVVIDGIKYRPLRDCIDFDMSPTLKKKAAKISDLVEWDKKIKDRMEHRREQLEHGDVGEQACLRAAPRGNPPVHLRARPGLRWRRAWLGAD